MMKIIVNLRQYQKSNAHTSYPESYFSQMSSSAEIGTRSKHLGDKRGAENAKIIIRKIQDNYLASDILFCNIGNEERACRLTNSLLNNPVIFRE